MTLSSDTPSHHRSHALKPQAVSSSKQVSNPYLRWPWPHLYPYLAQTTHGNHPLHASWPCPQDRDNTTGCTKPSQKPYSQIMQPITHLVLIFFYTLSVLRWGHHTRNTYSSTQDGDMEMMHGMYPQAYRWPSDTWDTCMDPRWKSGMSYWSFNHWLTFQTDTFHQHSLTVLIEVKTKF